MTNTEKIIVPIGVGAAVIGIWAALRNRGGVVQQLASPAPSLNFPAVPALQYNEAGPVAQAYMPGSTSTDGTLPSGTNPSIAATDPIASVGTSGGSLSPYSYLNYNVPPWLDLQKLLSSLSPGDAINKLLVPNQPRVLPESDHAAGCGCSDCNSDSCNVNLKPKFPDGHGACMNSAPTVTASQLDRQIQAMRYFAATPLDCSRTGSQFDANCLSLFYSNSADKLALHG